MNRDLLKQAIKKLVLQEITNNQFGTKIETNKRDEKAEKGLTKELGKDADVGQAFGTGKTAGATDKQTVTLSKNADDCYDVVSITNESERKIARGVTFEAAMDLVKQHAKDCDETYVKKAYNKSLRGFGKTPPKKEEVDEADKMDDVDEQKQIDIADKTTEKAEVKADKDNAPEVSAPMGGDLVSKIEKIVDRVLKDKAEAKSAYLKHDKKKESPDKLSVELKDTPALKEKKS